MNIFSWKNAAIVLAIVVAYVVFIKPNQALTTGKKCSCKDKEEQPEKD